MKHYKDSENRIFAYEPDGSQDHLIGNKIPISVVERDALIAANIENEFAALPYQEKRRRAYPPIAEFVDAMVKQDEAQLESYRQKCFAVKNKYPKQ